MVQTAIVVCLTLPLIATCLSIAPAGGDEFWDSLNRFNHVTLQLFLNSVIIGAGAAAVSICFALPAVFVYFHLPTAYRRFLLPAALLPLSYPPFGAASAWMTLVASIEGGWQGRMVWGGESALSSILYNYFGVSWVLGLCYWPVVFFMLTMITRLSQAQVDAAYLHMRFWSRLRYVFWPAWRESLFASAAIVFCMGIVQFEVPSFLQVQVYPLEIFTRFSALMNERDAVFLCVPYGLILLSITWCIARYCRSLPLEGGEEIVLRPRAWFKTFSRAALCLVLFLSVMIPLLGLLSRAGSLGFMLDTLWQQKERMARSLMYCGLGAGAIVFLGLVFTARHNPGKAPYAGTFFLFLFVFPGIMFASGWLQIRSFWPGVLPKNIAVFSLILAYVTHFFVLGYFTGLLIWNYYGAPQREYDSLLRMGTLTKIFRLYVPNMKAPVLQGIALIALFLWGEVAMTILLHPAGGDTMALHYYNLLHYGSEKRTVAIGLLMMGTPAFVLFLALLSQWLNIRRRRGSVNCQ